MEAGVKCPFKEYGRALEWGYPMGVGYRYLTLPQTFLLLRCSALAEGITDALVSSIGL
jgi:hypothetical protein